MADSKGKLRDRAVVGKLSSLRRKHYRSLPNLNTTLRSACFIPLLGYQDVEPHVLDVEKTRHRACMPSQSRDEAF